MNIRFLGTAAAEGIPGIFCQCPACRAARAAGGRELRTRSGAIVDGRLKHAAVEPLLVENHIGTDDSSACATRHAVAYAIGI